MSIYDHSADVYAALVQQSPLAQKSQPFYLAEYLRTSGPVVELGVGEGRIAVEAAQRGKAIIGVDASAEMLALCRHRIAEAGVESLVTLIEADFRDFVLPEPAELIAIPFQTFVELLETADKETCLRHIYTQLAPGGRLIFDYFVFDVGLAQKFDNSLHLEAEYTDPETGRQVLFWVCSLYDFEAQQMRAVGWTDELDAEGVVVRRKYRQYQTSWCEPQQIHTMLLECGFEIEAFYGDYQRVPATPESGVHVWIARKPTP